MTRTGMLVGAVFSCAAGCMDMRPLDDLEPAEPAQAATARSSRLPFTLVRTTPTVSASMPERVEERETTIHARPSTLVTALDASTSMVAAEDTTAVTLDFDTLPGAPWQHADEGGSASVSGGVMTIETPTFYEFLLWNPDGAWHENVDNARGWAIEARLRVDAATASLCAGCSAVQIWANDHTILLIVGFSTNEISIAYPDLVHFPMDTTDAFHTYRVTAKGMHVTVAVDGVVAIDHILSWPGGGSEVVSFGDGDGSGYSKSYWASFSYDVGAPAETPSPAFRVDWAQEIGPVGNFQSVNLVAAGSGRGFIAGRWQDLLRFPDRTTYSHGSSLGTPAFLAGVTPAGAVLWNHRFGGDDAFLQDLYATAANDAVAVVAPSTAGDVGCGPVPGLPQVVAEYDGATGVCKWMRPWPGAKLLRVRPLPSGDLAVMGNFDQSVDLGGGLVLSSPGSAFFVGRLDSRGHPRWARVVGEGAFGEVLARALATDSTGAFFIAGDFDGVVTLGGGTVGSSGRRSSFVMGLDPQGNAPWRYVQDETVLGFGEIDQQAGRLAVTGVAYQPFTFAGTEHQTSDLSGVVLAFGRDGHQRWAQTFPGATISAVTVDDASRVNVAGATATGAGQISVGALTIQSDAFLAVLNSETGSPVRANPIGDSGDLCRVQSLSFGADAFRLMGGSFTDSCHLDRFVLSPDAAGSGFYARLVR